MRSARLAVVHFDHSGPTKSRTFHKEDANVASSFFERSQTFSDRFFYGPSFLPSFFGSLLQFRERDWGHILTAHRGQSSPLLWSLTKHALLRNNFQISESAAYKTRHLQPTSIALSQCGNFGFVGYECGSLHMFNVQSGIHRGTFRCPGGLAHRGSVSGCASDRFNRKVISAGLDGVLRLWTFKERKLKAEFRIGSAIPLMHFHRGNALCAVATEQFWIHLFDCETKKRVRKFRGHTDRMTCLQISSDGHWLLSSAMDHTLRIHDIPSGTQIQVREKHELCDIVLGVVI